MAEAVAPRVPIEMKRNPTWRMRVRGRAIVGFLLIACATETVPLRSGRLDYTACDGNRSRMIADAFDRAARLGERAAAAIDEPEKHALARADRWPQYTWWFGDYSAERYEIVRDVLDASRSEFDRAYEMRCAADSRNCPREEAPEDPDGRFADRDEYGPDFEENWGPGRAWKVFAYANTDIRSLQICEDFFSEDPRERAAILFHEITHVVRDTEDHTYRKREIFDLAIERPDLAVHNAANYQGFATSVESGRLPSDDDGIPDDD
jgi:hypothetical protein